MVSGRQNSLAPPLKMAVLIMMILGLAGGARTWVLDALSLVSPLI